MNRRQRIEQLKLLHAGKITWEEFLKAISPNENWSDTTKLIIETDHKFSEEEIQAFSNEAGIEKLVLIENPHLHEAE